MAFTDQEKSIISYGLANGKTKEEVQEAILRSRLGRPYTPTPPEKSTTASVLTGAAKGVGDTLRGMQKTGNLVTGALVPGLTASELNKDTEQANLELTGLTDEDLKAANTPEKVGKALTFLATMLSPTKLPQKTATMVSDAATGIASDVASAATKSIPKVSTDWAMEAATPKITQKIATEAMKKGTKGVSEPGLITSGELVPNQAQSAVRDVVSKYVGDANSPATVVDNLATGISKLNARAEDLFKTADPIFNKNQLRTFLNKVKDESSLAFSSGDQQASLYDALIETMMKQVEAGKASALFRARKDFDKLPEVKKLLASAKGEFQNARQIAVADVRRAANDFLEQVLQEGSEFRAILKEESQLYTAIRNIAEKYGKTELTKSKLRQLIEKVPFVRDILQGVLPAGAVSAGLNAID